MAPGCCADSGAVASSTTTAALTVLIGMPLPDSVVRPDKAPCPSGFDEGRRLRPDAAQDTRAHSKESSRNRTRSPIRGWLQAGALPPACEWLPGGGTSRLRRQRPRSAVASSDDTRLLSGQSRRPGRSAPEELLQPLGGRRIGERPVLRKGPVRLGDPEARQRHYECADMRHCAAQLKLGEGRAEPHLASAPITATGLPSQALGLGGPRHPIDGVLHHAPAAPRCTRGSRGSLGRRRALPA